ncbi:MAG: hypothetical protein RIM23_06755 [Coleofasciculus sp. G3-WIS-01]|uniref:hypothetical protein n=1 Tax=Coleofasciculus sp. G3-WIS-01 TaxID=3069528 RepID=UPI0032FFB69A
MNEHTAPKLTNKIAIQSLTYQTIKSQFNLVANMAVRACARVAANRKAAKQKGKPVKGFMPSSMDCDKDLFRFCEHDSTVSLATIHGRERVNWTLDKKIYFFLLLSLPLGKIGSAACSL